MTDLEQQIADWLEASIKSSRMTQSQFAQALGMQPSAISRVLKGERQLSAVEMIKAHFIFDAIHSEGKATPDVINAAISSLHFNTREGAQRDQAITHFTKTEPDKDLLYIGSLIGKGPIWNLPQSFLAQAAFSSNLCWFIVQDEVMSPTLIPGDVVLIDADIHAPDAPGIYALSYNAHSVMLRRLDPNLSTRGQDQRVVRISADNARYPDRTEALMHLTIAGRCIARVSSRFD